MSTLSCKSVIVSSPSKAEKGQRACCCSGAGTMQRNAAVLTVVCLMTCLTFNYTFPLHRKVSSDSGEIFYPNQSQEFDTPAHHKSIAERSKKMTNNIENALKRIKDSTQDFGKNILGQVSSGFKDNVLTEDDLRQYEQLVIMKKYPYLDLKELELKYSPSKNTRQSLKSEHNSNVDPDPSIWESLEEGPNVEIINRGLTGFAIPPELTRHVSMVDNKVKYNYLHTSDGHPYDFSKLSKKSSEKVILGSLKTDVKQYVEKKNKLE